MDDKLSNIVSAMHRLIQMGMTITNVSHLYVSKAWGFFAEDYFMNNVVEVETSQNSEQILGCIEQIEERFFRKRDAGVYRDRPVDIDILFFNSEIQQSENICIPHPLFHLRSFCVLPMKDIDPLLIHPVLQMSVCDIYSKLSDDLTVFKNREFFRNILSDANTL